MAYAEVMAMPMRAFWHFSGSTERLLADEARLTFELHASVQSPEAGEEMRKHLHDRAPNPVKLSGVALATVSAERDEAGFEHLRAMGMGL
jgi:hypothetical protein